jgi:probable rRNA maturation factor
MIDNRSGQELPLDRVEELAAFVLSREGLPDAVELSLSFVTVEEITELNATYRDKPCATDVLSFELDDPWGAPDSAAAFDALGVAGATGTDAPDAAISGVDTAALGADMPSDGTILMGDIVICPDVARERAESEDISFEEELWVLIIHGILHLAGYDHEEADEMAVMEGREDEYFSQWELSRKAG